MKMKLMAEIMTNVMLTEGKPFLIVIILTTVRYICILQLQTFTNLSVSHPHSDFIPKTVKVKKIWGKKSKREEKWDNDYLEWNKYNGRDKYTTLTETDHY